MSDGSPLQFAAAEGLSEIIKLIITKSKPVNRENDIFFRQMQIKLKNISISVLNNISVLQF